MNSESERSVEHLLKLGGEREIPPAAGVERARLAAHESWQRVLREQPGRPRHWLQISVALAAAAGCAWFALLRFQPVAAPEPQQVARVIALTGSAVQHDSAGDTVLFAAGDVFAGTTLETTTGRVALTLGGALSLRMDRNSRLRLDGAQRVTLLAGTLYVDSGGINAVGGLRIETPAGVVRHVGTQFQVFVAGTDTRVRVREGRVLFSPGDSSAPRDVVAGEELRIAGDRADFRRGLPSSGADWEWCASIAPPFDAEGRPLAEFLAWAVREHGWQLRYSGAALQQQTYEIRLHGALDQSSAEAMVERVSLITGVPLRARDGVLWVGAGVPQ
jgi:ferric-dicitrate binding protein FerR (iron transport regulator)